ncbi:MAG: primosomal protein N' (replication factor Y) - superfamily II helicase [Qingshengfaniella sp.]
MANMPPPPPSSGPADTHHFACSACGADMRYDPAGARLLCDHCGHTEAIAPDRTGPWVSVGLTELDFRAAVANRLPEIELETTQVLNCPGCGAQVEFRPDEHAAECPFCATPVVTGTGANRHIKPKGVAPFRLNEDQARKAMTDWLGRLWFAPSSLQKYARHGRRMAGIYVPYWTYDARTRTAYRGQRGKIRVESYTVMVDGKPQRRTRQRIDWYPAAGRVTRDFDDVLVLASSALPRRFTEALEPWDLGQLRPYTPSYLAGFRAEAYGIPLEDGFTEARDKMRQVIERDVRFHIGGDVQRIQSLDTDTDDITFKHVLLPVWVAAYRFGGKSYRFVVNGQTGRVQGERPWSPWKLAGAILAALLIAAVAGYIYAIGQG